MNTNFNHRFAVVLALAAILLQSLSVQVSAAFPTPAPAGQAECENVLENAEAIIARFDIPASRSDYAMLERLSKCHVVAGIEYVLPVTGRSARYDQDFLEMKDRQAEQMDRGAYTSRTTAGLGSPSPVPAAPITADGYH